MTNGPENLNKDTDDEQGGYLRPETVEGIVKCYHCDYWGKMEGFVEPDNREVIQFVCPECKTIEKVVNLFGN